MTNSKNNNSQNIAIDIRCLLDGQRTGVAEYTYQTVKRLIAHSEHQFFLFYNSYKHDLPEAIKLEFSRPNVTLCKFNVPNKIFNSALALRLIKLNSLIEKKYSITLNSFWFPNISFIHVSDRCRLLTTVHDASFAINPQWFAYKAQLWHAAIHPAYLIHRSNHIFTVSHTTAHDIHALYNKPLTAISPIHLGIEAPQKITEEKKEQVQSKYNLPKKIILFLATLEPRKNIESLIAAYQSIDTDYKLVIVGKKGWRYKHIFKQMNAEKSKPIHYINYIDADDKAALYSFADIFVFASFYEGFGLPPLEAASYKTAIICSTPTSMNEIFEDAACYVNSFSVSALQTVLQNLLQNPELRKNYAHRAYIQSQKFSWDITAHKIAQTLFK
jgi:glycosyltransferase involved in cell wall biosynthesis